MDVFSALGLTGTGLSTWNDLISFDMSMICLPWSPSPPAGVPLVEHVVNGLDFGAPGDSRKRVTDFP